MEPLPEYHLAKSHWQAQVRKNTGKRCQGPVSSQPQQAPYPSRITTIPCIGTASQASVCTLTTNPPHSSLSVGRWLHTYQTYRSPQIALVTHFMFPHTSIITALPPSSLKHPSFLLLLRLYFCHQSNPLAHSLNPPPPLLLHDERSCLWDYAPLHPS